MVIWMIWMLSLPVLHTTKHMFSLWKLLSWVKSRFTTLHILHELKVLKNTACGPDDLTSGILREYRIEIDWSRSHTFLTCLWTQQQCPTFSKGHKLSQCPKIIFSTARPVSLTCILACVLEGIIVTHSLKPSLGQMCDDNQFGFQPGRNTEHALLLIQNYVAQSLEGPKCDGVRMFTLEFKKAFDNVKYEKLFE